MQLLNSNIPQSARITKYSNKKAQDLLNLVLFLFCSFFVLQRWRKRGDSLRDIFPSSLVIALLLLYFSHFYYFIVAITPGLQTTVSSVVWSACFCCRLLYRLQADSQPVRIPFRQRQNKTNRQIFACSFCLAER